jgi:hypothetical protein
MRFLRAGFVSLIAFTAACGSLPHTASAPAPKTGATSPDSGATAQSRARVEIDNQNASAMNIYLIVRGTRVLLGWVNGLAKTTLPIPASALSGTSQIRLLADPTGSGSPIRTPTLLLPPGQTVYWTIGADQAGSFASVG